MSHARLIFSVSTLTLPILILIAALATPSDALHAHQARRMTPQEQRMRAANNAAFGITSIEPEGIDTEGAFTPDTATATITTQGLPSYIFPSLTTQVPVATICANNTVGKTTVLWNSTANNSVGLLSPTGPPVNATDASISNPLSDHVKKSTDTSADIARIIQGDDGCQTVYAPTTTAVCSTSLDLAGLPSVSVTDCGQWITFSTSSAIVPSCASTNVYTASSSGSAGGPVVGETIYNVAHWWDLLSNHVPSIVRVENCLPDHIGDACTAYTESWEVSSVTSLRTGWATMTFHGVSNFIGLKSVDVL